MGRPRRVDVGGYAYHLLNRSVGRYRLFRRDKDFEAFERVLAEAVERSDGDVLLHAYCVMGNHWHLVVRTTRDGALSPFMKWLTLTHTQRFRVAHGNVGEGPVYQGRYKSFVIENDRHFLTVCRYVERNAARASEVARAEEWQWSSLWRWRNGKRASDDADCPMTLSAWPTVEGSKAVTDGSGRPRNWLRTVNTPLSEPELAALQAATNRCQPYGRNAWVEKMVELYGLESTRRRPGRPKNAVKR